MKRTPDPYFDWLCIKVGINANNPKRMYTRLAEALHRLTFKAVIDDDENRAMDGLQLRVDFMEAHGTLGSSTNRGRCTMLEMIVALAKRINYLMGSENNPHHTGYWFFKIVENLGLMKLDDDRYDILNGDFYVQDAADRLIFRLYDEDGKGGMFPLNNPSNDQRTVEIWYQMQAWLIENDDISLDD